MIMHTYTAFTSRMMCTKSLIYLIELLLQDMFAMLWLETSWNVSYLSNFSVWLHMKLQGQHIGIIELSHCSHYAAHSNIQMGSYDLSTSYISIFSLVNMPIHLRAHLCTPQVEPI